jgi:hypothetical protein
MRAGCDVMATRGYDFAGINEKAMSGEKLKELVTFHFIKYSICYELAMDHLAAALMPDLALSCRDGIRI